MLTIKDINTQVKDLPDNHVRLIFLKNNMITDIMEFHKVPSPQYHATFLKNGKFAKFISDLIEKAIIKSDTVEITNVEGR